MMGDVRGCFCVRLDFARMTVNTAMPRMPRWRIFRSKKERLQDDQNSPTIDPRPITTPNHLI